MAVKLRLARVGSKKNPIYRVVAADSHSPRDGKFIEIVGRYNPQHEPSLIEFDEEKVRGWLPKGALPTEPVARLRGGLDGVAEQTGGRVHRVVQAGVDDARGDQGHHGDEGLREHRAVADEPNLAFLLDHLRRRAGGD